MRTVAGTTDAPSSWAAKLLRALGVCLALGTCGSAFGAEPVSGTVVRNTATVSFAPSGSNQIVQVDSNSVQTQVIQPCAAPQTKLTLRVSPDGAVAPGSPLRYELSVRNIAARDLLNLSVTLPLDVGLQAPVTYTGQPAGPASDQSNVRGVFNAALRTLTWTVERLAAGDTLQLDIRTFVRPDLGLGARIRTRAHAEVSDCTGGQDSNEVETPIFSPAVRITKTADSSTAAPGDAVFYEVRVRHTGDGPPLVAAELIDRLPAALRYAPGTARRDGRKLVDPLIDHSGRTLRFNLGALGPGDQTTLRYAAIVGPTAMQGETTNRAFVDGRTSETVLLRSNEASATVSIVPGPFRQEAHLLGRLFVDDDGDGVVDPDEPGVPNALVMLEDGASAVTDVTGRWSLLGVRPGVHLLRIDPSTLPPGIEAADSAINGDSATRFVEARAATLVVEDFPLAPAHLARCQIEGGMVKVALPRASLIDADGVPTAAAAMTLDAVASLITDRGQSYGHLSLRCLDRAGAVSTGSDQLYEMLRGSLVTHAAAEELSVTAPSLGTPPTLGPAVDDDDAGAVGTEAAPTAHDPLEATLRQHPVGTAILSPGSGERATRGVTAVEVLFPLGATPELTVNGVDVPGARIGINLRLPSRGLAAARYVGVPLNRGENILRFRATVDGEAVGGGIAESRLFLPGEPVAVRLTPVGGRWVADGRTPGVLRVEAIDAAGMRSIDSPVVTLVTEGAQPTSPDLDPRTDGYQVRLDDGSVLIRFAPLQTPGRVRVLAFGDKLRNETLISVAPGGGPWRAFGMVEGSVAGDGGVEGDGGWGPGLDDGIAESGGRVALFARGPVGDQSRLTVSLDTARHRDRDRLFGPYEPDLYFPVTGDTSNRNDEAERQGTLFARLDSPHGYAQWGDFATGFDHTELARYDRRLDGLSARREVGRLTFDGFAAPSDQTPMRDLFAPDGTSGPYLLSTRPVVARSETVICETRNRFRTDEVITRQVKLRDLDYTVDVIAGSILFRAPIAPFDADLNPVRIIVLYEARTGRGDEWTAGGRVAMHWNARLETGLSLVREGRQSGSTALWGLDLNWQPWPGTEVRGEFAGSDPEQGISATAKRLEIRSRSGNDFGWELTYRDLPIGFENPTYLGSPELGTTRIAGALTWQPSPVWRFRSEALLQKDERIDLERRVAGLIAERQIGEATALAGIKAVSSSGAGLPSAENILLDTGLRGRLGKRWSAELLRSQALRSDDVVGYPTRTALGLGFDIATGVRGVLRHEIESSARETRDRTLIGVESQLGERSRALANYALEEGATGPSLRATVGLETAWPLSPTSSVTASFSRVDTTRGDDASDFTSIGGGYEYRAGSSLFTTRYELRLGRDDDRHLLTTAGAFRPNDPWTLFLRSFITRTDGDLVGAATRGEWTFGAAFRPTTSIWQCLARLDGTLGTGVVTSAAGVVPRTAFSDFGATPAGNGTATIGSGIGIGAPREAPRVLRESLSLSLAIGARFSARQRVAASIIARAVAADRAAGLDATVTQMTSLHYTAQIDPRWMVGTSARWFGQRDARRSTYGAGIELGYQLYKGLWLTGGYNLLGFDNPGFPTADRTEQGPYLSMRLRFDERTLQDLGSLRLDQP